jgi:type II secretory pathway pseudopilin PulG
MSRRLTVGVLLFGLSAVAVVSQQPGPVTAQNKNKVAVLQQEVVQLQAANAALQQQVNQLQSQLKKSSKADDKTAKSLQSTVDGFRNAGLVHVVVLKLKADSSEGETQSLIDDTYGQLAKIKTVRGVWAGKPSTKGTPDVAKDDYTVALVMVFDDPAGLKKYLDDPAHTKFADKHLKKWEAPVVYDFEPKKPVAP